MPNIMITKRCNLACPYCFANQFVNHSLTECDMSMDRFQEAVGFVLGDGSVRSVGLIGGEPTCHPSFDKILTLLSEEPLVERVTIYTNGIRLGEYLEQVAQEKFFALINCNSPDRMGSSFAQLKDLLLRLRDNEWKRHVTLGVNFYEPDFDFAYMLELIDLFRPDILRVSVCVPNETKEGPFAYFQSMKSTVFAFFQELLRRDVAPFFDCNIFPPCLISTEEMRQFAGWGERNPFLRLKSRPSGCTPVIDIMDDLTAVRCFGLSDSTRVSIRDFASITDLRNYYLRTVDAYAINTYREDKCANCYQFKTMKCSGGCLVYKADHIQRHRKTVEESNGPILPERYCN